jgi:hypothetical protein
MQDGPFPGHQKNADGPEGLSYILVSVWEHAGLTDARCSRSGVSIWRANAEESVTTAKSTPGRYSSAYGHEETSLVVIHSNR